MAPSLLEKAKLKARRLLQTAPQESSTPSPQTLSPTPSRPASQLATRSTSQPTPSPPTSTDSDTSSLPSLQERLWNEAYDGVKASEPKLVGAYEKILSAELHGDDPSSVTPESTDNEIGETPGTRSGQMQQLVQAGLDRTQKQASIKRAIDEGLQAVQEVRRVVDKAVHAAPEAAVAWVGVCLGLEILSNPVTEARDNRKGIIYVLSRMEWYWNLVSLLLDENKAEQSSAGLRAQLEKHVVQLYEKLLSYQMKSVCLYRRNWAAVIGRDILKLDDWAGQLSGIQEAEGAVQRDMEQYNTEESKMQLRKLTDAASAIEMNLQDIHSAIQDQTRQQEKRHQDDGDKQCLKDLRETDPRDDKTRIQETKGGLLRDSYRWILDNDDFRRWRDDPQSQLLWIKGDPGKGKTMLLCGIIDELEREPDNRLSYFFCQATEARLSSATAVLRGLIYLLVVQQPSLISHVREKHDHAGKQLFEDGNAWEALSKTLTAMLNDPSVDGAILIIDALDECKTNRHQLLDFITKPSRVKWIVSSRNWPDIEEKLDNAKQKVRLRLELNKDSISKAVNTYIGHKVNRLAGLKKYDKETCDAVKDHLTSNADGTFLWVALVCQELADPKVRKRHTLDTLKSFPPGLDPLYKRMVEHISDSKDADRCKEILALASVVYRPITLDELKALAESLEDLDQDELEEIIGSCGSFLTLREGIIYFVHQSAKDFLLSKASDQILPSGAAHQHHAIFSRSLAAFSQTLERDVYELGFPGFPIDQVSPPDPDPLASIRYSCVFWVDHLHDLDFTEINSVLRDNGDIDGFIREKYLYWLESLSLLRSMSEGVKAVHKLEGLVRNVGAQQLTKLLQDARRFILSNRRPIEIAPLQAYASALVFSPKHSLIRELYKIEEPDWMALKPRIEADWSACVQTLEGHGGSVRSVVFSADGQRLASGSEDETIKIWDAATGACIQTLVGHGGWVNSVVFSADGQRLTSGSCDKTVKIWDAATGACVQTLEGYDGLVFSADGQYFASGLADGTVKIWDAATGACVQTLEGHGDWVNLVVFSADGKRLASGSEDETVKIWDAATGACVQTLRGYGDLVTSVVFSVDGQRLALGSADRTVQIWDAATGAWIQMLEGHSDQVESMVFSADGQRLASGSRDKTVKIWDAATGARIQTLKGHGDEVKSVVFSVDGQRLASGSEDKTIKIWDAATGACVQTFEGHGDEVESVVFSADGQRLTSDSRDKTVKIWDAATGACIQTLEGYRYSVNSVVFSADGQYFASYETGDMTVEIWDAATGACVQTLEGHGDEVESVVFSADGQYLASGSRDKTVKIWDAATGACIQTLEGHRYWVESVVFSADGQRLASGSHDETVKIWDAATGACVQTLKGHSHLVTSVVFSADGQRLASGSGDGTVKIWDAATGACVQTLEGYGGHLGRVKWVVFSADGQYFAKTGNMTVEIWDAATGACIQTLEGYGGSVESMVFSADGQYLASGSYDETVKIWDAATGACVQTLEGHGSSVTSVVFSADGQRLASGSEDETVKIWDTATGACVQTLEGYGSWVKSVVFSADGQRLASGSDDSTVKIWDAATGACEQTLEGHGSSVTSVVFSADGQRFASGSDGGTVKIWDAATGACLQTLDVGSVHQISFDPTTNTLLSTDIGLLDLDHLAPAVDDRSTKLTLRGVRHSGWGISTDGVWIVKDGKEMLWLPPDYRGAKAAIVRSTVAIGCRSGRVLVMKFS